MKKIETNSCRFMGLNNADHVMCSLFSTMLLCFFSDSTLSQTHTLAFST